MRRFELNKKTILHLCIFVFISLIFTMSIGIFEACRDDAIAHISRIYNLAQSFKSGNFDPFIYDSCYLNLGYPYGIFYPDMFLKPFALFVSWGMNEYMSYMLMIFTINFLTMIVTYFVTTQIKTDSAFIATICYFIYPYRIYDMIWRHAVGELLFFAFLPIVIWGIYKLFYKKEFSWGLTIGLICILNSHILSAALTVAFLLIFYLCNIPKIIKNPKILLWTSVNAALTILCSLKIIIPILETQITEILVYNHNPAFLGTVSSHAFQICPQNIALCLSIVICIAMIVGLIFIIKFKHQKYLAAWSGIALLIATTNLFPWMLVEKIVPFVSIIQFPSRLLCFAVIPFVIIICEIIKSKKYQKIILISLSVISILFSFFFNSLLQSSYNLDDVIYRGIGQGDYLNLEFDKFLEKNDYSTIKALQNLNIDWESAHVNDNKYYTKNGYIPKLYYKNYEVTNQSGDKYEYINNNGLLFVPQLVDDDVVVNVIYSPTLLQKASTYISNIGIIMFVVFICFKNINTVKERRKESL